MTLLGSIFVTAYILGFALYRRIGVLAVAAAAIPFNDSAALMVGGIPVTPFYLGLATYMPLVVLKLGMPRTKSSLPYILFFWAAGVTLLAPAVFAGMPVVASGLGLDEQVNRLTSLDYSSSNIAQLVYLFLNLSFLAAVSNSDDTKRWIPIVPAVVGTIVASVAWLADNLGFEWPNQVFRNNTRNAYAYVETSRLSAQFSEPSHLAVFTLTSAVLLSMVIVIYRFPRSIKASLAVLVVMDVVLIIESASATALAGAGVFALFALGWGFYRAVASGFSFSRGYILAATAVSCAIVIVAPRVVTYVLDVIEYKLSTGVSIRGRTAADLSSWHVFLDSGTIGVGLGSNRSSSLLFLLLSTVGAVGLILFLMIILRAIRNGLRFGVSRPWAAALAALVLTSFVSLADLVSPMMWLLAAFCWNAAGIANREPTSEVAVPATLARS